MTPVKILHNRRETGGRGGSVKRVGQQEVVSPRDIRVLELQQH